MPSVKIGIYGGELTKENVTLEHIIPCSKGGRSRLENFALATEENNSRRKSNNLKQSLDYNIFKKYLAQFRNIRLPNFNGKRYMKLVLKTVDRALRE